MKRGFSASMILDGSYARILASDPTNKSVLHYPAK